MRAPNKRELELAALVRDMTEALTEVNHVTSTVAGSRRLKKVAKSLVELGWWKDVEAAARTLSALAALMEDDGAVDMLDMVRKAKADSRKRKGRR